MFASESDLIEIDRFVGTYRLHGCKLQRTYRHTYIVRVELLVFKMKYLQDWTVVGARVAVWQVRGARAPSSHRLPVTVWRADNGSLIISLFYTRLHLHAACHIR